MRISRAAAVALLVCFANVKASMPATDIAPTASAVIAGTDSSARDIWDLGRWQAVLSRSYVDGSSAPIWFTRGQLSRAGHQLLTELQNAEQRGLISADYVSPAFLVQMTAATSGSREAVARADVALSAAALRIAVDLHDGRVKPAEVGYDLDIGRQSFDAGRALELLAASTDTAATLDSMEPLLQHYALLKRALVRYRTFALESDHLTRLPPLPRTRVRPGESYIGAPALRQLLALLGDLVAAGDTALANEPSMDPTLVSALSAFQVRHGLDADGVLGRATFRELTTPFAARVEQINLSLERMRWLPSPLPSPPIVVNIPQFRLFAFRTLDDSAADILQMDVIVGQSFPARRTPVFAAEMRYAVIQPFWDVPRSILTHELLPDILRRPAWIDEHDYEIVRGDGDDARRLPSTHENVDLLARGIARLRQKPGSSNALGRVKFMFPNPHSVYLHDTPARALFSRSRRAFSHGCIRVSDPLALLDYVMQGNPDWSHELRDRALAASTPTRVSLSRTIPVFILYGTALATEAGDVQFFDDIYAQDAPLHSKLVLRRAAGARN